MPVANFFDLLSNPEEKHIDSGFSVKDFLEASFEFIDSRRDSFQFLFPTKSRLSSTSSTSSANEIFRITSSSVCRENFLKCFSKMLCFYGLDMEIDHTSTPHIKASESLKSAIRNTWMKNDTQDFKWINNHNNSFSLIAEMMDSCELLGLTSYSNALRDFLKKTFSSSKSILKIPIERKIEILWKINDRDLDLKELLLGFEEFQNADSQTEGSHEEQSDYPESLDKKVFLSKRIYPHYGVGDEELADKIIRGAREYAKTSGTDPSSFIQLATLAHKQKIFDEIKSLQQETFSKTNEKLARNIRIMQLLDPTTLHSVGIFFSFNNEENSNEFTMIPEGSQFIFRINSYPDTQIISVSKKNTGEFSYSLASMDEIELLNISLEFKISEAISKVDPSKKDFHSGQSLLKKDMERDY